MENPKPKSVPEESSFGGIYIYRGGLREARRRGAEIDLYSLDGTYDKTEPVKLVQQGNSLEIYDYSGNKIGTESLEETQDII